MRLFLFMVFSLTLFSCSVEKLYQANAKRAKQPYEQINFVELMKKYMDKNTGNESIEGIYSVSGIVLKKSKGLFATEAKERTVFQKDHYAQGDKNSNDNGPPTLYRFHGLLYKIIIIKSFDTLIIRIKYFFKISLPHKFSV